MRYHERRKVDNNYNYRQKLVKIQYTRTINIDKVSESTNYIYFTSRQRFNTVGVESIFNSRARPLRSMSLTIGSSVERDLCQNLLT